MTDPATLWAISDLHVAYRENRAIVEGLWPDSPSDWLIVAGDVGEIFTDVVTTLTRLRERFAQVIWAPGNHELWTHPKDPVQLRGVERYSKLVEVCRRVDVLTPEDPYPVWTGPGGPVTVAPLFLLYDYSFRAPGTTDTESSLAYAYNSLAVAVDRRGARPEAETCLLYTSPSPRDS